MFSAAAATLLLLLAPRRAFALSLAPHLGPDLPSRIRPAPQPEATAPASARRQAR